MHDVGDSGKAIEFTKVELTVDRLLHALWRMPHAKIDHLLIRREIDHGAVRVSKATDRRVTRECHFGLRRQIPKGDPDPAADGTFGVRLAVLAQNHPIAARIASVPLDVGSQRIDRLRPQRANSPTAVLVPAEVVVRNLVPKVQPRERQRDRIGSIESAVDA